MNQGVWLQIVLVISLAFNVATGFLYFTHDHPHENRMPDTLIERMTRHMSDDDSRIVRNAFEAHSSDFRKHQIDIDESFAAVRAATTATPFDKDALQLAMEKAQNSREMMGKIIQAAILDAAGKLSIEGREKMLPPPPHDHGSHEEHPHF